MTGLGVDYQLLDRIYASLGLASQFKNIQAVQDSYNGVTGSGDITGAMNGFAANRGIHRKKLTGSMGALQTMVHDTRREPAGLTTCAGSWPAGRSNANRGDGHGAAGWLPAGAARAGHRPGPGRSAGDQCPGRPPGTGGATWIMRSPSQAVSAAG